MNDLRQEFHTELEELRNKVARLGATVVELPFLNLPRKRA